MEERTHAYLYGGIALVTAVIVALMYSAFTLHAFGRKAITQINVQKASLITTSILVYGIVESVDTTNRTVTARFINPFFPNETRVLTIHLLESALIAQQTLLGTDGEYSGLTSRTPAPLSSVTKGTRIAALIWGSGSKIESSLLLFGNPL